MYLLSCKSYPVNLPSLSANAFTSSILLLIICFVFVEFWREIQLAHDASKSYTTRRRATRRLEELHDASKSYTTARRVTRRVKELHDASKSYTTAQRVTRRDEVLHDESTFENAATNPKVIKL